MDASWLEYAIGPYAALVFALAACFYLTRQLNQKSKECDSERERADKSEEKYVRILQEQILDMKERDKTIELISRVAANSSGKGEPHD